MQAGSGLPIVVAPNAGSSFPASIVHISQLDSSSTGKALAATLQLASMQFDTDLATLAWEPASPISATAGNGGSLGISRQHRSTAAAAASAAANSSPGAAAPQPGVQAAPQQRTPAPASDHQALLRVTGLNAGDAHHAAPPSAQAHTQWPSHTHTLSVALEDHTHTHTLTHIHTHTYIHWPLPARIMNTNLTLHSYRSHQTTGVYVVK